MVVQQQMNQIRETERVDFIGKSRHTVLLNPKPRAKLSTARPAASPPQRLILIETLQSNTLVARLIGLIKQITGITKFVIAYI